MGNINLENENSYVDISGLGKIYKLDKDKETINVAINKVVNGFGEIEELQTTNKENLVDAINSEMSERNKEHERHRKLPTLDHPDESVKKQHIAKGAVSKDRLNDDVHIPLSGICPTSPGTQNKIVECSDFKLYDGARITVNFFNGNTASYITLNVNNTGKRIVYFPIRGSRAYQNDDISKVIVGGCNYEFVYQVGAPNKWVYCGATNIPADGSVNTASIIDGAITKPKLDTALTGDINKLKTNSHTHGNKTILDGIDSADIATWNGIKEQVNKTELEEAVAAEAKIRINEDSKLLENIKAEATTRQDEDAQLSERLSGEATIRISEDRLLQGWINTETTNRQNEDGIIRAELNEHQDYMNDITYGVLAELQRIYTAMGVTFYDGGLFGMVQDGLPLDGGDFESEPTDIFDCGGFEPLKITISAGAVIDGGTY